MKTAVCRGTRSCLAFSILVFTVLSAAANAYEVTLLWSGLSDQSQVLSDTDHAIIYRRQNDLDVTWRHPLGPERALLVRGLYRWEGLESHLMLSTEAHVASRSRQGFVELSLLWEQVRSDADHELLWRVQLDLPGSLGASERTSQHLPGVHASSRLSGHLMWTRIRDPALVYISVKPTVAFRRYEHGRAYRIGPQLGLYGGLIYAATRDVSLHFGMSTGWKGSDRLGSEALPGTKASWTEIAVTASFASSFETEWQIGVILPVSPVRAGRIQFGLRKHFD